MKVGQPWAGMATWNPFWIFGNMDSTWAGWLYAVDADTGVWKWRAKSNCPIVAGVTPTTGGVVFFGDVGGNFYALDSATRQKLGCSMIASPDWFPVAESQPEQPSRLP